MKRKILSVICICLMVAMVSGCGSKDTDVSDDSTKIRQEENDLTSDSQLEKSEKETEEETTSVEMPGEPDESSENEGVGEKTVPATIEILNSLGTLYRTTSYDASGKILAIDEYNEAGDNVYGENYYNGKLDSTIETEYDAAGNQIKWAQIFTEEAIERYGYKISEYRYAYDAAGKLIKEEHYTDDHLDVTDEYIIGEDGRTMEDNRYNNGKLSYRFVYSYEFDEAGNVVRELQEYYDTSGTYRGVYTYEYEYDDKNNQIKKVCYNNDGSIYSLFEYDSDGNLLMLQHGGTDYVIYREYNEAGYMTKSSSYSLEGMYRYSYEYEYEYDAERNILIVNKYDDQGKFTGWDEEEYR